MKREKIARGKIARGRIARGKIARGKIAREKIARGRIPVPSPSRAHFDFAPFLRHATQAGVF